MSETNEPDDFEIQLAPGNQVESAPPEFRHDVIDEVMPATGQTRRRHQKPSWTPRYERASVAMDP